MTKTNVIEPSLYFILENTAKGRGPNRVPINGLLALGSISVVFILIGGVNTLGPVVTMPFMITYAAVDYAFFALTMSPAAKGLRSGEELGKEKEEEEEEEEEVGVGAEAAYGALPTGKFTPELSLSL